MSGFHVALKKDQYHAGMFTDEFKDVFAMVVGGKMVCPCCVSTIKADRDTWVMLKCHHVLHTSCAAKLVDVCASECPACSAPGAIAKDVRVFVAQINFSKLVMRNEVVTFANIAANPDDPFDSCTLIVDLEPTSLYTPKPNHGQRVDLMVGLKIDVLYKTATMLRQEFAETIMCQKQEEEKILKNDNRTDIDPSLMVYAKDRLAALQHHANVICDQLAAIIKEIDSLRK